MGVGDGSVVVQKQTAGMKIRNSTFRLRVTSTSCLMKRWKSSMAGSRRPMRVNVAARKSNGQGYQGLEKARE